MIDIKLPLMYNNNCIWVGLPPYSIQLKYKEHSINEKDFRNNQRADKIC